VNIKWFKEKCPEEYGVFYKMVKDLFPTMEDTDVSNIVAHFIKYRSSITVRSSCGHNTYSDFREFVRGCLYWKDNCNHST